MTRLRETLTLSMSVHRQLLNGDGFVLPEPFFKQLRVAQRPPRHHATYRNQCTLTMSDCKCPPTANSQRTDQHQAVLKSP